MRSHPLNDSYCSGFTFSFGTGLLGLPSLWSQRKDVMLSYLRAKLPPLVYHHAFLMCDLIKKKNQDQNHMLSFSILIIHKTTENTATTKTRRKSLLFRCCRRNFPSSGPSSLLPENKPWLCLVASITIIKADPQGPCWQNHILICSPWPPLLHL